MAKKNKLQIGQRGTPSWAYNRLREDALVQLLNDLVVAEKKGLNRKQCDLVKEAMAQMVNAATAIPDGSFFTRPIWQDIKKFEDTYWSWNDHKVEDYYAVEHRRKELERLRKIRHKIAKRARKNLAVLDQELDIQLVKNVYEALGNLVTAAPDIFKNIARAIERFGKPA
jgi:hypothetical protein